GVILPLLSGCESATRQLVLVWPQLGDFDSLEYAWWLQREAKRLQGEGIVIRAVGIGNRDSVDTPRPGRTGILASMGLLV
ncbi:MAG: hypothetical protein F6K44_19810, partial [Moorea sp. SIO3E2]|nr:hypothetical protein [Moorena sp. SIO3E2]